MEDAETLDERGRLGLRPKGIRHGLSFDVECYYQIVWKDFLGVRITPTREVERNTDYLLELLADVGARATFFVLGNVALQFPALVCRIAAQGHELGVHGHEHRYIYQLSPEEFRRDLAVAVDAIQQAASVKVQGHRAAAFSVSRDTLWALDVLRDAGLRYDSSIFPVVARRYGIPDSPVTPYRLENGLYEFPLTVVEARGRRLPALGGGYFRVFPYAYTRWALGRLASANRAAVTYFHPHEFELSRPSVGLAGWRSNPAGALRLARFNATQAVGRGRSMRAKLRQLLQEYDFAPLADLLSEQEALSHGTLSS